MTPRIAVIIPVYNHAKFVGNAIDAVLAQTRKADCILVIDDGSKDDSLAVCQSYSDRGVQARGRENRGAHSTINELVQWAAAEGCDWVNILNSDDRFLPRKLEACESWAAAHPGKSVICGRLEVIDENGDIMPPDVKRARWFYGAQSLTEADTSNVAELLGKANFIATTSNVFARTDYLLANPFRPYRFNHDYFFLAGAAWRDLIAVVPEVLMQYRVHGNNTIATKPEPLIREMLRMHLDLYHHYAAELRANEGMRQRFADYCRSLWDSISSFHAGMFHVALAQLAAEVPYEKLEALAYSLQGTEFDTSPNRGLAGAYDGTAPLSAGMLSHKLDTLRDERTKWGQERDAWGELLRMKQLLHESRWVALGNLCGPGNTLHKNEGKGSIEKLGRLREACLASGWLKLGAALGSRAAKALRNVG
jgi:glycosyltransferase involved in cell wall biosynthesis